MVLPLFLLAQSDIPTATAPSHVKRASSGGRLGQSKPPDLRSKFWRATSLSGLGCHRRVRGGLARLLRPLSGVCCDRVQRSGGRIGNNAPVVPVELLTREGFRGRDDYVSIFGTWWDLVFDLLLELLCFSGGSSPTPKVSPPSFSSRRRPKKAPDSMSATPLVSAKMTTVSA